MNMKRILKKIHLWVGLTTGIIMFIVCITGAIWAFKLNGWVGQDKNDKVEGGLIREMSPPSELFAIIRDSVECMPGYITYDRDKYTQIGSYAKDCQYTYLVHPFSKNIYKKTTGNASYYSGFWGFIGRGHRALWLPWHIGRPIVNYATLLFVVCLLSGLIIWIPKTKKGLKNRLIFNWKKTTNRKRKIFDIHIVAGFYICFFLLTIACTGMVWGIEWWSKGLYRITTGGKELVNGGYARNVRSDSTTINVKITVPDAVDYVFHKLSEENPGAHSVYISYPDTSDTLSSIRTYVYYSTHYDAFVFDRYTLKELNPDSPYLGKYEDKSFGDKLRTQNYNIHIGAILGTPGKVLAVFISLFGASLPVTGVYMYLAKKRKRAKKNLRKKS